MTEHIEHTGDGVSKSEQASELVRCLTRPILTLGLVGVWVWQTIHGMTVDPELKTLAVGLATWWFADRARREQ